MDLEKELLREHSRAHTDRIARWVGADSGRLKKLMDLFLNGEFLTAQRAAWVVSILGERHPSLFRPYVKRMMLRLQQPDVHDAVKRCVVRTLQGIEIPRALLGMAANVCFEQLSSAEAPIAVKCFSMTVLAHIAEQEPDLGRELRLVIEQQLPYGTAGLKARAKVILRQLENGHPTLPKGVNT